MGQVRHRSATTTQAVRAAIQRSQTSLAQLSQELGISLEDAVDCFGQGVVIAVASTADGGFDACFGQPFGLFDRLILAGTSRTARSRTSGENLFVVLLMLLHPTQEWSLRQTRSGSERLLAQAEDTGRVRTDPRPFDPAGSKAPGPGADGFHGGPHQPSFARMVADLSPRSFRHRQRH